MKKLIQILIVCGLVVMMGGTASAGGCDYPEIFDVIASDDNYPDKAMHRVSILFKEYWDWPGEKDNQELKKAWKDSLFNLSKQGNGQASYLAGILYLSDSKYEESIKSFKLSKEQKYLKGYDRIMPCYEKNIKRNTYADGTWGGGEKGFNELIKWMKLAANQGNTTAQKNLKNLEDVIEKERLVKEAKKKAPLMAKQGDAQAQYTLGKMYAKGEGVPQDQKESVKWYTKAAEQGHLEAQGFLGSMYRYGGMDGIKVPKDYKEAVKWYTKAAEQGDKVAQYTLGTIYDSGENVPLDYKEAVKWYTKAAEQGHLGAKQGMDYAYPKMLEKEVLEEERLAKASEKKEEAAKAKEEQEKVAKTKLIMQKAEKYRDVVSKSKACKNEEDFSSCITIHSCFVASFIEGLKHDDRGKKFKKTVEGGLLSKGSYDKATEELIKSKDKDKLFNSQIETLSMGCIGMLWDL